MARKGSRRRIPQYFLYGEAPRRIVEPLLHIETIEARSAHHQWKIDPHMHQDLHQVIVVLRGRGVTMADGVRSQYRPPTLMVLPAGSVHAFEFEPGTTGLVLSMSHSLYLEQLQQEPRISLLFARPQMLELGREELRAADLVRSFRMLARELPRSGEGHKLALHGWLNVLLGNMLRLARDLPDRTSSASGQRRLLLDRFIAMVERRYRTSQSVGHYAAALKVSTWQLRRVCLALTGQSPVQLIHARILLEAKRMLHYSDIAAKEIAGTLGFNDVAYFSRFFSRRVGMSPRAFRRHDPEGILKKEPPRD